MIKNLWHSRFKAKSKVKIPKTAHADSPSPPPQFRHGRASIARSNGRALPIQRDLPSLQALAPLPVLPTPQARAAVRQPQGPPCVTLAQKALQQPNPAQTSRLDPELAAQLEKADRFQRGEASEASALTPGQAEAAMALLSIGQQPEPLQSHPADPDDHQVSIRTDSSCPFHAECSALMRPCGLFARGDLIHRQRPTLALNIQNLELIELSQEMLPSFCK